MRARTETFTYHNRNPIYVEIDPPPTRASKYSDYDTLDMVDGNARQTINRRKSRKDRSLLKADEIIKALNKAKAKQKLEHAKELNEREKTHDSFLTPEGNKIWIPKPTRFQRFVNWIKALFLPLINALRKLFGLKIPVDKMLIPDEKETNPFEIKKEPLVDRSTYRRPWGFKSYTCPNTPCLTEDEDKTDDDFLLNSDQIIELYKKERIQTKVEEGENVTYDLLGQKVQVNVDKLQINPPEKSTLDPSHYNDMRETTKTFVAPALYSNLLDNEEEQETPVPLPRKKVKRKRRKSLKQIITHKLITKKLNNKEI